MGENQAPQGYITPRYQQLAAILKECDVQYKSDAKDPVTTKKQEKREEPSLKANEVDWRIVDGRR
jgi:hypothetical protein